MSSRSSVPVETTSFGYFKSNLETLNEVLVDCEKCEHMRNKMSCYQLLLVLGSYFTCSLLRLVGLQTVKTKQSFVF